MISVLKNKIKNQHLIRICIINWWSLFLKYRNAARQLKQLWTTESNSWECSPECQIWQHINCNFYTMSQMSFCFLNSGLYFQLYERQPSTLPESVSIHFYVCRNDTFLNLPKTLNVKQTKPFFFFSKIEHCYEILPWLYLIGFEVKWKTMSQLFNVFNVPISTAYHFSLAHNIKIRPAVSKIPNKVHFDWEFPAFIILQKEKIGGEKQHWKIDLLRLLEALVISMDYNCWPHTIEAGITWGFFFFFFFQLAIGCWKWFLWRGEKPLKIYYSRSFHPGGKPSHY